MSTPALSRKRMQWLAAVGGAMALTPFFIGGFHGFWPFIHVTGGAMALFALVVEGLRLPSPQRWIAAAGVAISLVIISIVTGGGSVGTAVQIVVLVVLAAIYVAVVFWPRKDSDYR
jgi:O-antigen ligase